MDIPDECKTKVKMRLSKAIGHLNHVYKMVDERRCIEVLNQLKAVQSALERTAEILLEEHLETVMHQSLGSPDSSSTVDELLQLYRRTREI